MPYKIIAVLYIRGTFYGPKYMKKNDCPILLGKNVEYHFINCKLKIINRLKKCNTHMEKIILKLLL